MTGPAWISKISTYVENQGQWGTRFFVGGICARPLVLIAILNML